jgi:hypothetical protein
MSGLDFGNACAEIAAAADYLRATGSPAVSVRGMWRVKGMQRGSGLPSSWDSVG